MLLVLSPSKTLDTKNWPQTQDYTQPDMLSDAKKLAKILRDYSPKQLQKLMGISEKLADLNTQRYQDFKTPFTPENAKQALLMFKGDVYEGIDIDHYSQKDFDFAQEHVRILSGLYGLLRPLDLMQPYRLEMGTKLENPKGKNLYEFWGDRITKHINKTLAEHKSQYLINLASEEYFKAINSKALDGKLLTIVFKENQKGKLKVIGLFAKRARGLMTDYIVRNRIDKAEALKKFNSEGYRFDAKLSDDNNYIFTR